MNLFHRQPFATNKAICSKICRWCCQKVLKEFRTSWVASHFWSHKEHLLGSRALELCNDMCVCVCWACASALGIKILFTFILWGRLHLGPWDAKCGVFSSLKPTVRWQRGASVLRRCSSVNSTFMFLKKLVHIQHLIHFSLVSPAR